MNQNLCISRLGFLQLQKLENHNIAFGYSSQNDFFLLKNNIRYIESKVKIRVKTKLTQDQFDNIVIASYAYNIHNEPGTIGHKMQNEENELFMNKFRKYVYKDKQSDIENFLSGSLSVLTGMYNLGDYIARMVGFRDYQLGTSSVLGDFYKDGAIRNKKQLGELIEYIISDSSIVFEFGNYLYKYISENKARAAGRFLTTIAFTKLAPATAPFAITGDAMYGSKFIDEFARSIVLGH